VGLEALYCTETKEEFSERCRRFDIRVCGDYVYVNSQTERLQANAPNEKYQIEKASGKRLHWYTDQDRQYNQWVLAE
jgi:hypothetical protein